MYPFSKDVFAARNQWYVAAYSREVGRKPFERWFLDEPVVLYRKEDGAPVALEGRCAHRFFPLGEGKVVGDNLQCPYHGITYAPSGESVRIPSHGRVSTSCKVRSYPLAEKWRWIWIWMGEPELADPSLIPDHGEIGLEDTDVITDDGFYHEVESRYQLVHDNLMDLSHVGFLHFNTLGGGSEESASVPVEETEGSGWIAGERTLRDIQTPPHFARFFGYDGTCDRIIGQRFYLPSLHHGWDEYRYPYSSVDAGKTFGKLQVYHGITPARRNTTHYFFATARDFGREAQDEMRAATSSVIMEDVWCLSHVEKLLNSYGNNLPAEFSARADRQQLLARHRLEKMIETELSES